MKKNDPIEQLVLKAIAKFNDQITDEIFLIIQNDHELMYKYLRIIEDHKLKRTNQKIGKLIREKYKLPNNGRNKNPRSTLIKSYEKHSKKII